MHIPDPQMRTADFKGGTFGRNVPKKNRAITVIFVTWGDVARDVEKSHKQLI